MTRDSHGAQLDPGNPVGGDRTIVNGATSLQVPGTLEEAKLQDGVVGVDKKVPKVALKPKRTSGSKRGKETSPINGVPAGTVKESPQIRIHRSPSDDMESGLQESVQEEETTRDSRKSPVFVPDTSDSPRTPRLPRASLKGSPSPSPNRKSRPYHRSESEPLDSETAGLSVSRPTLEKSLSAEPLLDSPRFRKSGSGSLTPTSRKNSPETPTGGETPKTKQGTGSGSPSGRVTPALPRLAFDKVTVARMLDDSKKHRRVSSERRTFDFEPLTREERKRRRSSCESFFRGKLNALVDPSAGTSSDHKLAGDDFPSPSPVQFHTPQPKRRETGSETSTPKLKRPQLKATT